MFVVGSACLITQPSNTNRARGQEKESIEMFHWIADPNETLPRVEDVVGNLGPGWRSVDPNDASPIHASGQILRRPLSDPMSAPPSSGRLASRTLLADSPISG